MASAAAIQSLDHVERSFTEIAAAAALASPGRAIVLGCGKCGDIPIDVLTSRFSLEFLDRDLTALRIASVRSRVPGRHPRVRCHREEITGMVAGCEAAAQRLAASAGDPSQLAASLSALLDGAKPNFWQPPDGARYSLVVCSGLLTQLQAVVREAIECAFLRRFPSGMRILRSEEQWADSCLKFARGLEAAFLEHLDSLCAPQGIVYLADTVRVCWLSSSLTSGLMTQGAWIATKSARLADYLGPRDELLREANWDWLRLQPEGEWAGRLYDVQALTYRRLP